VSKKGKVTVEVHDTATDAFERATLQVSAALYADGVLYRLRERGAKVPTDLHDELVAAFKVGAIYQRRRMEERKV
jgi:hypothetical protein